jgi:DNA gyrase inhibitor GyrI
MMISGLFTTGCLAFDYESAYEKTPSSTYEIKRIPSSKTLVTESEGKYFDQDNSLFMRLFDYIKKNDVAMTIPVEARMNKANMVFYVGSKDTEKNLQAQGPVKVVLSPERQVASLGMKGSYSEKNFKNAEKRLKEWLDGQNEYVASGEAYGVYWNGPFVPWFLKRFEVHIPVEKRQEAEPLAKAGNSENTVAKK